MALKSSFPVWHSIVLSCNYVERLLWSLFFPSSYSNLIGFLESFTSMNVWMQVLQDCGRRSHSFHCEPGKSRSSIRLDIWQHLWTLQKTRIQENASYNTRSCKPIVFILPLLPPAVTDTNQVGIDISKRKNRRNSTQLAIFFLFQVLILSSLAPPLNLLVNVNNTTHLLSLSEKPLFLHSILLPHFLFRCSKVNLKRAKTLRIVWYKTTIKRAL